MVANEQTAPIAVQLAALASHRKVTRALAAEVLARQQTAGRG